MTLVMDPETVFGNEPALEWLREQGIAPSDTYKVCVNAETMIATVFQNKRDRDGQLYYDPESDDIATVAPWTKQLTALPPSGYWHADDAGFKVFAESA